MKAPDYGPLIGIAIVLVGGAALWAIIVVAALHFFFNG